MTVGGGSSCYAGLSPWLKLFNLSYKPCDNSPQLTTSPIHDQNPNWGAPLLEICSLCLRFDTWISSKCLHFASWGISRTLPHPFFSPFFELMLYYRNLAIFLLLPPSTHSFSLKIFGAISCPRLSHFGCNKKSFGGTLDLLRLVLWSTKHEVIFFLFIVWFYMLASLVN